MLESCGNACTQSWLSAHLHCGCYWFYYKQSSYRQSAVCVLQQDVSWINNMYTNKYIRAEVSTLVKKHYASNIIAGVLSWVNGGNVKFEVARRLCINAARQLYVYTKKTVAGNATCIQCFQLKEATRWFLNIVYIICCKKVIMQA